MTRGRRDNGLDAALWTPLRDVDPRVGEHLLDVLRAAGIAAYLEPAADVGPYTRTVFLPSPPSDRLWVDRARRAEARGLVERNADEHPAEHRGGPPRECPPLRGDFREDLDEEAEWRRIVAALEAEQRTAVEEELAALPPPPAPPPAEPEFLELPEEHYEPPPPPPLRAPAPASLYAVLLIAAGALLVGAPNLLRLSFDAGLVLGFAGVVGGVAILVARMRDRSDDDGDDGAIV